LPVSSPAALSGVRRRVTWELRDRLNGPGRYPFPSLEAATRFAKNHKEIALGMGVDREITIDYPDGRSWDGKRWVA
jgi:hypothetical protein